VISIVTPTFRRPAEIAGLLENLSQQTLLPSEIIIVDGATAEERETEEAVARLSQVVPFRCVYIRQSGGTAIQRNSGIDAATGKFVAFIDDDVRLQPDFLKTMVLVFEKDSEQKVGGVVGYRTNQHFDPSNAQRWRWYRRLGLLTVFEPGRYDFQSGYPINANMQRPFEGVRPVDFMTTACALWRREVFDSGLRFDHFFCDYGILEDAHLSLRAGRQWQLLQCGDAHCEELRSPNGRLESRRIGYKCVVNYYYVFQDIVRPLTWQHKMRFWRFQAFELFRVGTSAIRRRRRSDWMELRGRLEGIRAVIHGIGSGKQYTYAS
jgi:glycosyltransferase involved in cell wall biosynthesis